MILTNFHKSDKNALSKRILNCLGQALYRPDTDEAKGLIFNKVWHPDSLTVAMLRLKNTCIVQNVLKCILRVVLHYFSNGLLWSFSVN